MLPPHPLAAWRRALVLLLVPFAIGAASATLFARTIRTAAAVRAGAAIFGWLMA